MGPSRLSIPGTITVSARFSNDSRQGTRSVTLRRRDLWLLAACPHLITGPPFDVSGEPEYLQRRGEIAEDHAVERHNRHQVRFGGDAAAGWLKSCEDCLFSHWSNYRAHHDLKAKGRIYACGKKAHQALLAMDYVGPAISAVLFVLIMSFVPEPTRLRFNAIFAAGAVGGARIGDMNPNSSQGPQNLTPLALGHAEEHIVAQNGLRLAPVIRNALRDHTKPRHRLIAQNLSLDRYFAPDARQRRAIGKRHEIERSCFRDHALILSRRSFLRNRYRARPESFARSQ